MARSCLKGVGGRKEEMKEEEEQKEEKAFLRYWRERKGKRGALMPKIH